MPRFGQRRNSYRTVLIEPVDFDRFGRVHELGDLTEHDVLRRLPRIDVKPVERTRRIPLPVVHQLDDRDILSSLPHHADRDAGHSRVGRDRNVLARQPRQARLVLVNVDVGAQRVVAPIIPDVDGERRGFQDRLELLRLGTQHARVLTEHADRDRNQRRRPCLHCTDINPRTRDTRGERLLERRDQCVGVLAVRELKQKLRVVGRWRLGRNGEPESRSARPDKARHRSQHPLLSAVMLRRLFLHHHLRLADGLFRSRERCVFGEPDVDVGDVEVLTREKLVMEVRREKPAEDQQDRKPRQHLPAMIDRKPDGPAVPTPEPALPPGVDGRLRFRPQQIEGEQRNESHRDQARSDQ